ncbi:MmcQ/YjbR family DNA-binding protein [Lacibacter luteus]|nr:MmcQ/YjbR family DNA-binding protein [Lacibacter luteus]
MLLSFAEVKEEPHFDKRSFRVKKKIVATLDELNQTACVKLTATEQSVYCLIDETIIKAVPNKWGLQGWTFIYLKKIKKNLLYDVIVSSYCSVAPRSLAQQYLK